jgi:gamma-glutamyl-gamma-aminobutyrate hydrolase PuuD
MTVIAITQRVECDERTDERRDALDQRWASFLARSGLLPLALPNRLDAALAVFDACRPSGIILSGGGDLVALGGTAPERDALEAALIARALEFGLPLLGVCRGMQALLHFFGCPIEPINGHVRLTHSLSWNGQTRRVNSYHRFGARTVVEPLTIVACAADGSVEAVAHRSRPDVRGIMWHPERMAPADALDIRLFQDLFGAVACED